MAESITYADITNGFDTSVPEAEVDLIIDSVDAADVCLDANSVPAANQKLLKIYAVRHQLVLMGSASSGKGSVTSESAPSGASRSYRAPQSGGLDSTSYGILLKQLDKYGCVTTLLENNSNLAAWSVGRGV